MTVTTSPAALGGWRVLVVGLVGLLAVGIGLAAGSSLLSRGSTPVGVAAQYIAADAPFYFEWRLDPSTEQDVALRQLLGRFPPIEGVDLDRPLFDQLGMYADDLLGLQDEVELSWEADIAPWFDGTIAVALTEVDWASMAAPIDPMAEPVMPGFVVVVGSADPAAARTFTDRMRNVAEANGVTFTESEHRGVTVHVTQDDGAFAITEDAVLVAPTRDDITGALDAEADGAPSLATSDDMRALIGRLPTDWIGFAVYDFTDMLAASFEQAAASSPAMGEAMRDIFEHQPLRGALTISAGGDGLAFDSVTAAPTGPFAVANAERGLAAEVPADALYFTDAGNIGPSIAAFMTSMKEGLAADPMLAEQIDLVEAGLGADVEELVSWIGDGALVAGWDGSEPYLGLVLLPTDRVAAERRLDQLVAFAGLAASDPASGIAVEERDVAGTTVTTITWTDPNADAVAMPGTPTGLSLEVALSDDRALLGLGDRFVGRVLQLDASESLASVERFAAAVEALGGHDNASVAYVDLRGTLEAVEAALGETMQLIDPEGIYRSGVRPWLAPLDRFVGVSKLEGDVLVTRTVLYVE